jgi:hypothetical protein
MHMYINHHVTQLTGLADVRWGQALSDGVRPCIIAFLTLKGIGFLIKRQQNKPDPVIKAEVRKLRCKSNLVCLIARTKHQCLGRIHALYLSNG